MTTNEVEGRAMGATELLLVRHGESTANVAAARAEASGADVIAVDHRDADVPLTDLGEDQAHALGQWLRDESTPPGAAWSSSYLRARQTISIALGAAAIDLPVRVDDRLRDRELGILDRLTTRGVENLLPQEADRRRWLGRFYYRPPGGESWVDVALRLRSFLKDVDVGGGRVIVATHDAVILLFVYVCSGLDERELLDFARENTVTNASVTRLVRPSGEGMWSLDRVARTEHLDRAGVKSTEHQGSSDAEED